FWLRPSFRGVEIARQIDELLPEGAVIAGDWAPFFALGSDLRALYVAHHNSPESIVELRADYFVFSETLPGHETLRVLQEDARVELGSPVLESDLAQREVRVYPIRYRDER
ncbi:MAG TPA: hypothetical protein VMT85_20760, partial [Thermoanaerobaculia bacterium]|nr:hypothetical protein [Thermoanaerobaculia bacterium]